ncbi:MAG: ribonuclease III [Nevskia sp.]|nr:ribonuclease III [Nevskia sp.]
MSAKNLEQIGRVRLCAALGYQFLDAALLQRALTHRSFGVDHNERLEFLGDALLNFAIAAEIFRLRPKAPEGDLSRLRASIVREETLAAAARRLPLSDVIRLGSGELRTGGFRRDSTLADVLEALIGAVYLDGGTEPAHALCLKLLAPELEALPEAGSLKDYKTRLQEVLQAESRPLPEYTVLSEDGPAHRRNFAVRCLLPDSGQIMEAEAHSRRIAEQRAASAMLDAITLKETKHA